MNTASDKTPFKARCAGCEHVFVVYRLPMPMNDAARLMKQAACPMCAGKKLFVATGAAA